MSIIHRTSERMKRRILIAFILFAAGAAAYLSFSGAPPRVHFVRLPLQFVLLGAASVIAWLPRLSVRSRTLGVAAVLLMVTVVGTWLMGKVIAAFIPLDALSFVMVGIGFTIEAVAFLAITFGVDRVIAWLSRSPASVLR